MAATGLVRVDSPAEETLLAPHNCFLHSPPPRINDWQLWFNICFKEGRLAVKFQVFAKEGLIPKDSADASFHGKGDILPERQLLGN